MTAASVAGHANDETYSRLEKQWALRSPALPRTSRQTFPKTATRHEGERRFRNNGNTTHVEGF